LSKPETESTKWDIEISPSSRLLNFNELWKHRYLISVFASRDITTQFKQTLLGPLWYILHPLLTTFLFVIVFGKIANLDTDGSPRVLFYLSGIIIWQFFSSCFISTANVFTSNAYIFGKVYFPRLVIPVATVISLLVRFFIQIILFAIVFLFLRYTDDVPDSIGLNAWVIFLPVLLLIAGCLGLGCGLITSSLTYKYKDLSHFIGFAIQFLMYLSPVIYPSAMFKEFAWVFTWNPLTYVIESFRYGLLGTSEMNGQGLIYAAVFAILVLLAGVILFNNSSRRFMDTV